MSYRSDMESAPVKKKVSVYVFIDVFVFIFYFFLFLSTLKQIEGRALDMEVQIA